jgi:hypothetical protein
VLQRAGWALPKPFLYIHDFYFQEKIKQTFFSKQSAYTKGNAAGVPKGSVLLPTLFNMYINNAPKHMVII